MSAQGSPSSLPPRPPGTSGGNKFLLPAVLVGVGLVALIAFKKCGSQPQTGPNPIATVIVPSGPPTTSKVDEVPLPPPVEDAAPAPTATAKPTGTGVAFDACAVKSCNGTITAELENALALRVKQARRCYDQALANDPTLQGRVELAVKVASNGQVCGASVASNDLSDPNVASCMAGVFRQSLHFPTPKGGCVETKIPIALKVR
ncbi:MAG: AgmX/PglI C-terminal domain-containing protein [Polyangiaceae bacterium]